MRKSRSPSAKMFVGALALSTAISTPAMAAQPGESTDRFASVRKVIAEVMDEAKVPSIALAVVKDGKIIWEEGFGYADKERQIAATAHTPYSLASMTKPITATAVMELAEAGKIDIDAPVERYLGGIELTEGAGSSDGVTARRLMAHSAGLPKYGHFYLDGAKPAGSKETISKYGLIVFPPNTRVEYSNMGMKILDAAIEQVSGQTFGDYLRREVFLPLGMKDSAVGLTGSMPAAVRYDSNRKPMRFYLTDHPGSGDVWASADDMARFLAFHMGTPLPDQKPVLSRATTLAMQRPASAGAMSAPGEPRRDIGANWMLSTINGHPQIWHSGGQPGVSAFMTIYPDQKLAFVLLANSSGPLGKVGQAIREAIAPEVMPPEADGPPPAPGPIPFKGKWVGTVTNYAGEQPITLTFGDKDEIAVQLADQERAVLQRASFVDGALSGRFDGKSNLPEASNHPYQLTMDVVRDGDELVGQVIAQGMDDKVAFMLPSFVRLRPAAGND